jgi:hypothetical protein
LSVTRQPPAACLPSLIACLPAADAAPEASISDAAAATLAAIIFVERMCAFSLSCDSGV